MSTYEITYRAHTGLAPERIEAIGHSVDESTTPPTHRFRIMATRFIERIGVEDVREIQPEEVPASPLPPFARQVSNRAFPHGRRPGSDG